MRKTLLIASALLTASMSFAGISRPVNQANNPSDKQADFIRVASTSSVADSRLKEADEEGPILNPEGQEVLYVRNCRALAPLLWFLSDLPINGAIGSVVFGDDNVVYLSPVVNNILGLGYVKGTVDENNIITFQFPQFMGELQDGSRLDMYCMNNLGIGDDGWALGAEISGDQTYKMQIAENGTITPLPEYENTVIGWSPDGKEFAGYGDYGYKFVPQTDVVVTPPNSAVQVNSTWGNGTVGYFGKMAIDGNDLYVQHMFPSMPESWVKCTKSGDGYQFKSGQLLGIYDPGTSQKYWNYAYAADYEIVDDPEYGETPMVFILEGMDLLPEGKDSYKSTESIYSSSRYDIGAELIVFDLDPGLCVLSPREESEMLLTPKAPVIQNFSIFDMGIGMSASYAFFNQPQYSVDDILINPNNLYYEAYANGELITFTHADYPAIPEEGWTMIPYTFSDGQDMINNNYTIWSDIHEFMVYRYMSQVGIRSVCKVGDEVRYSEMAFTSPEGVEGVTADSEVVAESLTNLAGVKVTNPGPGIYIRTTRHADGSVRTAKVIL
ncbi:MAG: hypothetical protein HDS84_07685 [Bacteroidales bacterium]|nr:hypothetical protein [Bacteroidales bacterium]MBD5302609.1 hypothetical protein [Bacteroides sp.]